MLASWKTTLAGIGTILAGLGNAAVQYSHGGFAAVDVPVLVAAIAAGIGLIAAKDSGVSNAPAPVAAARVPPAP